MKRTNLYRCHRWKCESCFLFFSICSYTDWYHAFLYFPLQKYVSLFRRVKRFYPHNSLCRREITMEELLLYLFFLCLTKISNFQIPASSSVWKQFLCSHTLPHAFIFRVLVVRDFFCFTLPLARIAFSTEEELNRWMHTVLLPLYTMHAKREPVSQVCTPKKWGQ